MSEAVVQVAVAVILSADEVLIARRPEHVHQGGLWEFPGGKIEAGESVEKALAREISEELNLTILSSEPLMVIQHDYRDKQVELHIRVVTEFSGEARGLENQPLQWVSVNLLQNYEFPAANAPIPAAIVEYLS